MRTAKKWANAQADLSHRWAHTYFVGFVMSRLTCRNWAKSDHIDVHRTVW